MRFEANWEFRHRDEDTFGCTGCAARWAKIGKRIAGYGVLRFEAKWESSHRGDDALRMSRFRGEFDKDRNTDRWLRGFAIRSQLLNAAFVARRCTGSVVYLSKSEMRSVGCGVLRFKANSESRLQVEDVLRMCRLRRCGQRSEDGLQAAVFCDSKPNGNPVFGVKTHFGNAGSEARWA